MLSRKPSRIKELHQRPAPTPISSPLPRQSSDTVVILPRNYNELYRTLINPGPQYRNSRTGNRSTRTQIDHDVFEGLPVRHWRKKPINVNAAPEKENIDNAGLKNLTWTELPMPRDAHLLSPMSQDLLRAARMPQAKKPSTPLLDDNKEPSEDEDVDGEVDVGFVAKRWAVIPKELEGPEPEFLAKRRKGLPSVHGGTLGSINGTAPMRKTKIRKVDTEGNNSVWEVLVPEGHTVEGEVVEGETSPTQAPAPGTVVEGVGVVNAEGVVIAGDQGVPAISRRKPPPPKRKPKGPGRGRKKKVAFAGADGMPTANGVDGASYGAIKAEEGKGVDGGQGASNGETGMVDESLLKEGDEGSEEGSEDDEGEEGDREEGEVSPSPNASRSPTKPPPRAIVENIPKPEASFPDALQAPSNIPLTAIEPPTVPVIEAAVGRANERTMENPNDMLNETREEMVDEPMEEMLDEPMNEYIPGPTNTSTTQDLSPAMPDMAAISERETSAQVPLSPDVENIPGAPENLEKPVTKAVTTPTLAARAEPTTELSEDRPTSMLPEPIADRLREPAVEPLSEPVFQINAERMSEAAPQPVAPTTAADLAVVMDPSIEAEAALNTSAEVEPVAKAMPEPNIEAHTAAMTDPVGGAVAEPVHEYVAEFVPQPELDPVIERVNESMPEPVPERKFSFTRPTSSPKAPTPSPPTPIETIFSGLQAPQPPYLSPKAPTMSPPTPIDRTMSSSPDLPLAAQLPPQIDVEDEAELTNGPKLQQIPNTERISVEATPQVEPQVNAQITVEHDPLDGMAEPKIDDDSFGQELSGNNPAHFSDGEEDLLGSLERSLGGRDSGT